ALPEAAEATGSSLDLLGKRELLAAGRVDTAGILALEPGGQHALNLAVALHALAVGAAAILLQMLTQQNDDALVAGGHDTGGQLAAEVFEHRPIDRVVRPGDYRPRDGGVDAAGRGDGR